MESCFDRFDEHSAEEAVTQLIREESLGIATRERTFFGQAWSWSRILRAGSLLKSFYGIEGSSVKCG